MKAKQFWRASLVLGAWVVIACGEEPTAPQPELLSSTTHPLVCEVQALPVLSIEDQDIFLECSGQQTGNLWVAPSVTAVDACGNPLPVHAYNSGDDDGDGIPGSEDPDDFGPGPTTEAEGLYYVQYLAWDESYNIQGAMLSVHVLDTYKPTLVLNGPESVQVQCFLPQGDQEDPEPYVDAGAVAEDLCSGNLTQHITTFGEVNKQTPGTYTLEYQVKDLAQHWADPVVRTVEVIDNTAPEVTVGAPVELWPPTGAMRRVQLSECAAAKDLCDGVMDINSRATLLSITSDEAPDDAGDIVILDNSTFEVRAERRGGGNGRVYRVDFQLADSSDNVKLSSCFVSVPAKPHTPAVDDAALGVTAGR